MDNRELDAWLAVHAFEWRLVTDVAELAVLEGRVTRNKPAGWDGYHNKGVYFNAANERMACVECGDLPAYSTDPVASDALLDRMAELGWSWMVTNTLGEIDARFMRKPDDFNPLDPRIDKFIASASTKHLAIAMAAYKALGGVDAER